MELCSPLLLYIKNSHIQRFFFSPRDQGRPSSPQTANPGGKTYPHSRSVLLLPAPMLRVLEPTCVVVAVVVCLAEHCISFVYGTTRVVAQFSTRV